MRAQHQRHAGIDELGVRPVDHRLDRSIESEVPVIRNDADVETAPGAPIGEVVSFPCPEAVALEVSGEGEYIPVVRWAGRTYLLERNSAAAPVD